jgi:hypothetical protein
VWPSGCEWFSKARAARWAVAPSSPSPSRDWLEDVVGVLFVGVRVDVKNGGPSPSGGSHVLELEQQIQILLQVREGFRLCGPLRSV